MMRKNENSNQAASRVNKNPFTFFFLFMDSVSDVGPYSEDFRPGPASKKERRPCDDGCCAHFGMAPPADEKTFWDRNMLITCRESVNHIDEYAVLPTW